MGSTYAATVSRRLLAAATAAGVVTLVGTALPWLRSGRRWRTSYELLGLVERLDIARGPARHLVRWWPLVPLLVTATVVAAWWAATRIAAALALVSSTVVVHVVIVVRRAAPRAGLHVGNGPWVSVVGAVLLLGCCVALAVYLRTHAHARRSPRTPDRPGEPVRDR
jgi:hypothetical protein